MKLGLFYGTTTGFTETYAEEEQLKAGLHLEILVAANRS